MPLLLAIASIWIATILVWVFRRQLTATTSRGWLLAIFPALSFSILLRETVALGKSADIYSLPWISSLNLNATLYFDPLSALFALLVTGIGTLIIIYAGYYFKGDKDAWRFLSYLFLFMGMMLGLVLAGDLLTLFIFWEGTSLTSFLLVAYKYKYESARDGAFRALFITGGGGIALLAGFLFLSHIAGTNDFASLLISGDIIRASNLYPIALLLIAFGAFTKSAQFPAHIWLPKAMSAPTPASAFLHSATMVKAGIYLMARLNPALGYTEMWFWLLSITGLTTMFVGAYLGTKQDDLKGLLAYSTISQLGILMMLIGQDTAIAYKALIVGIVAHAFYKSALFMLAGIIDLETGTRSLARLGGLRKQMPLTFGLVVITALSLAGLPPLFGFLAKETLLATAIHPTLPVAVSWGFATIIVVAAALKIVQAGMLALDVFTGSPRDNSIHAQEAPLGMLLAPAIPALLSLGLGILPEPKPIAEFLGRAAAVGYGEKVKVSFALWTGLNTPLLLSAIAIFLGCLLYWQRASLIRLQNRIGRPLFDNVYTAVLNSIHVLGKSATRLQVGHIRFYLGVMLIAMFLLVIWFAELQLPTALSSQPNSGLLSTELDFIRVLALIATVSAAIATVLIKRDFFAVLALGAAGLGVAMYMAAEPAPDVALVQIVVDILATVILVVAIGRLPLPQRAAAQKLNKQFQPLPFIIALLGGTLMSYLSFNALISRPRPSIVAPFYAENAKVLTGASDWVGAIIVDFRALDTLIEIAVFSLAGLGVYTLLQFAAKKHDDHGKAVDRMPAVQNPLPTLGIGGAQTSPYIRAVTNLLLPTALMIGATHILYGHVQPGDGFTAGVIISLAISLKYVVFGFRETRQRLWWLKPKPFIAFGILLVIANGTAAILMGDVFLAPVDYGKLLAIPLPSNVKLSSGFVFEVAIALAVLGSVSLIIDTLGRPALNTETLRRIEKTS